MVCSLAEGLVLLEDIAVNGLLGQHSHHVALADHVVDLVVLVQHRDPMDTLRVSATLKARLYPREKLLCQLEEILLVSECNSPASKPRGC
jgi:hypothetical protein